MFGEFFHNVDAKGRLSIPAKFRDSLGSTIVIGVNPDGCLNVYSLEEWELFIDSVKEQADRSTKEGRMVLRYFTSQAATCDFDSQGRIIIPNNLREHAGISKEVVVIGNGERAEVWDKNRYEEAFAGIDDDSVVSDLITKFGINM
jgi:MraZ protein